MHRLLINRIPIEFNTELPLFLIVKKTDEFVLNESRARWIRERLKSPNQEQLIKWMENMHINEGDFIALEFHHHFSSDNSQAYYTSMKLEGEDINLFKYEIFKQELAEHLRKKQFFIEPSRKAICFSAYQFINEFDNEFDRYRRIDFNFKTKYNDLIFNFGSEKSLITKTSKLLEDGEVAFNFENNLVYKKHGGIKARSLCPRDIRSEKLGTPQKFRYKERFEKLKQFAIEYLYDFSSPFFSIDRNGLKYVDPGNIHNVFSQQNLMVFGGEKTAINAVIGMREYGPLKKARDSEQKRLLFIYQNRNDANSLYQYLKNGLKHFPGLLSYTGIPVALASPDKGLPYQNVDDLPDKLKEFLNKYYSDPLYSDILAIVVGPFRRHESDEVESDTYFQVKKILLDKGIASQFVSHNTINNYGVQYSLPNIAVAILAKFGGVPWKLCKQKYNELIVGFNTKNVGDNRYLGSAVFFDNEGMLGGVKGFPANDRMAVINSLKEAISEYTNQVGIPEKLVIHYYKPPRRDEIDGILDALEDMRLAVPMALVEVNDSKSKLDICCDLDFDMGMPESGIFVEIGYKEYLLFNNNRYKKNPPRKIDDDLPIKLRLHYANNGGFSPRELIAQVYEFSRLNWKGLRQRSVPATTNYSKFIADFSFHFEGRIPDNTIAKNTPWFI